MSMFEKLTVCFPSCTSCESSQNASVPPYSFSFESHDWPCCAILTVLSHVQVEKDIH